MIRFVDEFILLDDVQYTHDWRNRNRIKTKEGLKWLTIPVRLNSLQDRIKDVRVVNDAWRRKHWTAFQHNYSRAVYFEVYKDWLRQLYLEEDDSYLTRINHRFLTAINSVLGISTKLSWSSDYAVEGKKDERVLNLCKAAGATHYISGPAAKAYLDEKKFSAAGIVLRWMDYSGYPEYRQLYPPFEHGVTILDLLLNEGPNVLNYMQSAYRT